MKDFQEAYTELIEVIENDYDINLSLIEKVSLKHNLKFAQENQMGRTINDRIGQIQLTNAKMIGELSYGINVDDLGDIYLMPEFKEYFRRVREKIFLSLILESA